MLFVTQRVVSTCRLSMRPELVDMSLSLTVGHLGLDESAMQRSPSAHPANSERRQKRASAASNSRDAPRSNRPRSSVPSFPTARSSRDYHGGC